MPELAPYALCLGYRIRYVLDMNAREAMQLIELRSGREGHPGYRAVAHELHAQIAEVHPAVAAAMTLGRMRTPSPGWSGSSARSAPRRGKRLAPDGRLGRPNLQAGCHFSRRATPRPKNG